MPKAYNYNWQALLKEQQESSMNMKQFCREKDIPYGAFKNHKYELQSASAEQKQFILVKTSAPHLINQFSFSQS